MACCGQWSGALPLCGYIDYRSCPAPPYQLPWQLYQSSDAESAPLPEALWRESGQGVMTSGLLRQLKIFAVGMWWNLCFFFLFSYSSFAVRTIGLCVEMCILMYILIEVSVFDSY